MNMLRKSLVQSASFRYFSYAAVLIIFGFAPMTSLLAVTPMQHKLLLAGTSGRVSYINLANPSEKWTQNFGARDIQLIGNGKFMIPGKDGYDEYVIATGMRSLHVGNGGGSSTGFRLQDGTTWLATTTPTRMRKFNPQNTVLKTINVSGYESIDPRKITFTAAGTFLIGSYTEEQPQQRRVAEFDTTGTLVWQALIPSFDGTWQHRSEPYMALRLPNGNTWVSTGYNCQLVLVNHAGAVLKRIPALPSSDTTITNHAGLFFFGGFQILSNGNLVVANWPSHNSNPDSLNQGYQVLEFDTAGALISYWKNDPNLNSGIHEVKVLDGLDLTVLHSDRNGALAPWGATPVRRFRKPIRSSTRMAPATIYNIHGSRVQTFSGSGTVRENRAYRGAHEILVVVLQDKRTITRIVASR